MFWKLSEEGIVILRNEIEHQYKSITKFSHQLKSFKIARQTIARFLKGEPIRITIAVVICETIFADINEFRENHINILPSSKSKINEVKPNLVDLLAEAYSVSSDEDKQKLITLCEKIIKENTLC